jgi:hypothetical protein
VLRKKERKEGRRIKEEKGRIHTKYPVLQDRT